MEFIYIGDLVNTHGLKGEVRILSDFKYKDKTFIPNFNIYVGKGKEELTVKTHRIHKNYDMVTFDRLNNIEDVLKYKGEMIYINRNDLNVNYLDEDLIGMNVYDENKNLGKIEHLKKGVKYDFLVIKYNGKEYMIPNIKEFVKNVDVKTKKIEINNIKGLIDED